MSNKGYYIDVHCHLIPGVDDGAKDMKESLEAMEEQYKQNVRIIICTPHVSADLTPEEAQGIQDAFVSLKNNLAETAFGKDMKLFLGCEMMYSESIPERLDSEDIWTMAESGYTLVEFLQSVSFEELYQASRQISDKGFLPVLAHIERYDCLYKRLDRINKLRDMGVYFQVNASSLIGGVFDSRASFMKKLCRAGLVHFLGTDSHGIKYRKPDMKKGAKWVEKHCNSPVKDSLLFQNGMDLLKNNII